MSDTNKKLSKKQRGKKAVEKSKKKSTKKTTTKQGKDVKKKSTKKTTKKVETEPKCYKQAVTAGKKDIKDGHSKAISARTIFAIMVKEERKWIIKAFIEGAELTKAGASTYHFNISHED